MIRTIYEIIKDLKASNLGNCLMRNNRTFLCFKRVEMNLKLKNVTEKKWITFLLTRNMQQALQKCYRIVEAERSTSIPEINSSRERDISTSKM